MSSKASTVCLAPPPPRTVDAPHATKFAIDVHESFSRAYRQRMSTKHVRCASDLIRFNCALRVECGACANTQTLAGFEVAQRLGTAEFHRIEPRLRCSRCGAK